jgi:hypothetical protein
MGSFANDPVDHSRTSRQRVGEAIKYTANAPGLLAVALGVVALAAALFAFAHAQTTVGVFATIAAVLLGGAGLAWLFYTHRRVRHALTQWEVAHPGEPPLPPAG